MGEWLEPAVELTIVGIAVVFLVLGSIAVAIALVGRIDARWRLQEAAAEAAASAREPTIDRITLGKKIDDEVLDALGDDR